MESHLSAAETEALVATFRTNAIEDDYTLEQEKLGDGVSGDVICCTSVSTEKQFALKVLPFNERSLKELDIWRACLPHPHIVDIIAVYDNILSEAHFLITRPNKRKLLPGRYLLVVMPRMLGGDLFDCVRQGRLPEKVIVTLVGQVTDALSHIHALGFVHGDLKLENILFEHTNSLRVRLCDFGFARPHQEVLRKPLYSIQYISPEFVRSHDHYRLCGKMLPLGRATDMWALGVLTFMMFARHAPFYGRQHEQGFGDGHTITPLHKAAVQRGCPVVDDARWQSVSGAARVVVSALLTPCPADRPTADELLACSWLCV